ncbi:tetratricopeptide repeat protein [Botrimarina hoheduenensis]|uniref:Tetratricopeptide repeat protein n=1 Tax=Botrimarina hoheduenensis TaxID=2528000 RepID=A0A5C5VXT7_9BACT|nr:tetratricopeptide repeat protein [Botrimarina hoheduenensis]TWT43254.1 tetratricopeptide repeat protein [Botrimarina hoheduenensis]
MTSSLATRLALPALLLGLGLVGSGPVYGQAETNLTPENLIGDSVSAPGDSRYNDIAEAIQRFNNRDQLSARTFLERAVQKNPKLAPVGVLMAKMQGLSGNGAAVRPALEQAVQEDSANDPEPYLLLAEDALQGSRTIEAEALFDKAAKLIETYENNAKRKRLFIIRAYRGSAEIASRREKWEQAESDLRTWIEQDPEDAAAQSRLGQALFMLDRPREGYEAFVKAKQLNADTPNAFVSAALMYGRLGKQAEAMEAFKKAFAEDAANETTLVAYAQALIKAGNMAEADMVLTKARASNADSLNVWLLSGVAARMQGDLKTAETYLMRSLSLAPSNRDVLNQLAQLLVESPDQADRQRALQFANMGAQLHQNNPDVNITLAWVLLQNGQGAQATNALRNAIQGGSLSPDGSYLFAKMLAARNDKANAKKLLESAMTNDQGIFVQKEQAKALLETL